jgi:hypothetical protein
MAKSISDLRDALGKVQAINEETWSKDSFNVELTRALTALENARMEWNGARLKFSVLSGQAAPPQSGAGATANAAAAVFAPKSFLELCKLGFAFTWPLVGVALLALGVLVAILLRPH